VLTSVAAGRRVAQRALVWQMLAVALVAGALLLFRGMPWALGGVGGGGAVVAGSALSGLLALGGGVSPATGALARMLLGVLVKWVVVIGVLVLAVGVAGLPPVAVLAGVIAAMVAQVLAMARL
jgi:ATP synthase protein I